MNHISHSVIRIREMEATAYLGTTLLQAFDARTTRTEKKRPVMAADKIRHNIPGLQKKS